MEILDCISTNYPQTHILQGVSVIEEQLLRHQYLVVLDENENYYGILTPLDLIKRPHKIVIDCLTPKEVIYPDDTLTSIFEKFEKSQSHALPVFDATNFVGIMEKHAVMKKLKSKLHELHHGTSTPKNVKNVFLNTLSHEIRTPLNGLLGFMEIVDEIDPKASMYSDVIKKSADSFLNTMNDLVDLAIITSGESIDIQKEPVCIDKLLQELFHLFEKGRIPEHSKLVYLAPDHSDLEILADIKKTKQILYHLIDSTLRFCDGSVTEFGFSLSENQTQIIFHAYNSGKISDKNIKDRITEIFRVGDSCCSQEEWALGVGLPLVKRLCDVLGGYVMLKEAKEGTEFICILPLDN
ncbi:MAG: histidine kinase dimerization/phospho-acceptor domain-containing protein [Breznakibacter sp.]